MHQQLAKVKTHTIEKRPAGTAAVLASLLVMIANLVGLHLDATQASVIVGGIAALVSAVNPLF